MSGYNHRFVVESPWVAVDDRGDPWKCACVCVSNHLYVCDCRSIPPYRGRVMDFARTFFAMAGGLRGCLSEEVGWFAVFLQLSRAFVSLRLLSGFLSRLCISAFTLRLSYT